MAPYHEFECTGDDNEYVVDIDKTEEALAAFNKATVSRMKSPDGALHTLFDENGNWKQEFSREGEYGRRELHVPAGHEKVEVPASEQESAAQWISSYYGWGIAGKSSGDETKYGFIEIDAEGNVVRCVDRTNPNAKWDWYVVGGRWSGFLRAKPGTDVSLGRRGLLGAHADGHRLATDQAMLANVDLDTMRAEKRAEFELRWDKAHAAAAHLPAPLTWEEMEASHPKIDTRREAYWAQEAIVALKAAFDNPWDLNEPLAALAEKDRAAYGQRGANKALVTFALVKDGRWFERGKMGWWAMVADEKDAAAWSDEFAKLLNDLPPTTWLTVIDCHI